jgi:uncharacterized protein YdbL (DUF1318 family)
MNSNTWIFLRSTGTTWQRIGSTATDSAPLSNLRTEIAAARSEGAEWQEIADAALLAVETVKQLATKEVAA